MTAFWISLFFVFAAEMGDKTQLVALAFATRFKAWIVLTGVFVATLLVHLFSVGIGEVMGIALPVFWIKVIAGVAFIAFGLWTLKGDKLDDEVAAAFCRKIAPSASNSKSDPLLASSASSSSAASASTARARSALRASRA